MKKQLKQLGLTKPEIEIYSTLFEVGAQTASKISEYTNIQRTHVYQLTAKLEQKDLIESVEISGVKKFSALPPENLHKFANIKLQEAEKTEKAIQHFLPALKIKYSISQSKPIINYYEGIEGVKKLYNQTLNSKSPLFALVETTKLDKNIYSWLAKEYTQNRVEKNIKVKAIVASGSNTNKYRSLDKRELRETKEIASKNYPFEHEIIIFDSKILMIDHSDSQNLLGILIEHQKLANTYKSWFKLTWNLVN